MWKQLFELFRQVMTLTENTQRNQTALREMQKELQDLSRTVEDDRRQWQSALERMAYEIQRLRDELRHASERDAGERERFRLKIENDLLKSGRQLPPPSDDEDEK